MRVRLSIAVGLVAWLFAPAVRAEGGAFEPVQPSTVIAVTTDGQYQGVGPVDAFQSGLRLRGAYAPHPQLEFGGAWGARLSAIYLDGGAGRTRAGLPPLRFWAGTGGTLGAWHLGLRLEGGVGVEWLDAAEVSSNGEWASARLEGALGWRHEWVDVRVSLRGGFAYAGASAWAGVGDARLGISFGEAAWQTRPFVEGRIFAASDIGWAARLGAGLITRFEAHAIRVGVRLGFPGDPVGLVFGLSLGWQVSLDAEAVTLPPSVTAQPP